MILLVQVLFTYAVVSVCAFADSWKEWVFKHSDGLVVSLLFVVTIIILSFFIPQMNTANSFSTGLIIFLTISISIIVGVTSSRSAKDTVIIALSLTVVIAILFLILAAQCTYDFTTWSNCLFLAMIILGLFYIGSWISPIKGRILQVISGTLGTLIMSAFILIDRQHLMADKTHYLSTSSYLLGAINLHVDVNVLFIFILLILGKEK